MKKESIEEGVKRTAIVIWLIWVVYMGFTNMHYPFSCSDFVIVGGKPKLYTEQFGTSWVDFWILNGCLFQSFRVALYALRELVVVTIVVPAIIYFPVVFIWAGFTKNWGDKNK